MADTITNDAALKLIAEGAADIAGGRAKVTQGHAALAANLAAPAEPSAPSEPVPPVVVEPPAPEPPVKTVAVALGGLAKAIAAAGPGVRLIVDKAALGSFSLRDVSAPAGGVAVDLSAVQIGNLQVANVANIEFVGLDLNIAQVRNSKAIAFTGMRAHDNPTSGLGFYSCQGVTVTGSTFERLKNGIVHDHCDDVMVTGNTFIGLTSDGVTGVGSVRVRIQNNDFRDFNPSDGAHPDAVQFFTRNAKRSSTDIVVSGNRVRRGSGGIVQGVFITTQAGFESFRYARVTVADNLIEGGMFNGIMVAGADDVTLTGNTVQPYDDQKSWIRISNCSGVRMEGNAYAQLVLANVTGLDRRDKETLSALAAV